MGVIHLIASSYAKQLRPASVDEDIHRYTHTHIRMTGPCNVVQFDHVARVLKSLYAATCFTHYSHPTFVIIQFHAQQTSADDEREWEKERGDERSRREAMQLSHANEMEMILSDVVNGCAVCTVHWSHCNWCSCQVCVYTCTRCTKYVLAWINNA